MNNFLDQLFEPLLDKELDPDLLAGSIKGGGGKKDEKGSVPPPPAPPLSTTQSAVATGGPPPPPPPPPPPVISTTQSSLQSASPTLSLAELIKSAHLKSSPSLSTSPPPSKPSIPPSMPPALPPLNPPPLNAPVPPPPPLASSIIPPLATLPSSPPLLSSQPPVPSLKPSTNTSAIPSTPTGVPLPPPPPPPPPPVPQLSSVPSQSTVSKSNKPLPPPIAPKPKRGSQKLSVSHVAEPNTVQSGSSKELISTATSSSSEQVVTASQQVSQSKTVITKEVTVVETHERKSSVLQKATSKGALSAPVLAPSASSLPDIDFLIVPPPVGFKVEESSSTDSIISSVKLQSQKSMGSAQNVATKQVSSQQIVQTRKISRQQSKETMAVEIKPVPSREKVRKLSIQIENQLQVASNIQRRASKKIARAKSIYRPGAKVTAHAAVRTADPEKNIPPRPAQNITLYSPIKSSTISYNNASWSFKLYKEVTN